MKKSNWLVGFGILLIALSALFYFIHYLIFRDSHHIFIYLLGDIAFVPIEVLLVTLIIHKIIEEREKKRKLEKINMILGVFFSEVGTRLLYIISALDKNLALMKKDLFVKQDWNEKTFKKVFKKIGSFSYAVSASDINMKEFETFLHSNRGFLIKLLENPALLEHDTFTDLLRAVFHLDDEFAARNIDTMTAQDKEHIAVDIKRTYKLLVFEWLSYMKYLKNRHPYYFLFAVKTSPFNAA